MSEIMQELMSKVGKTALLNTQEFQVEVKVTGYKRAYGRDRFIVSPVAGSGEATVEDFRLVFKQDVQVMRLFPPTAETTE